MIRFVAPLILLAAPAMAQDRMTFDVCDDTFGMLSQVFDAQAISGEVVRSDDDWCEIENGTYTVDNTQISLRMLRWRGDEFDRMTEDGLPPRSVEIEGRGLRVTYETGDPVFDYLLGLQRSADDVAAFGIDMRWDGVQNALLIDDAYVTINPTNDFRLSARIDGVDLTDEASFQSSFGVVVGASTAGTAGLSDLSVTSQFDGWFETYIAMALGTTLLTEGDVSPQDQVTALQSQAVDIVQELPDELIPAPSRDAVSEFINALPQPRGTARLQLSAAQPINSGNLALVLLPGLRPTPSQAVVRFFQQTTILFTWTPTEETP